jgi:hypothetical protein
MTITATPAPLNAPPKVDGQVAVPVGSVMNALEVFRTDPSGRSPIRKQPASGFDLAPFEDFDCPYGVDVFYDWVGTYTDPTTYTTVFNELWASAAAWTVDSGTFTVASGLLKNNATGAGRMHRALTLGRYRTTIASLFATGGPLRTALIELWGDAAGLDSSLGKVSVSYNPGAGVQVSAVEAGSSVSTTVLMDQTQPITIDILETSIVIVGVGASYTFPFTFPVSRIDARYSGAGATNEVRIGAVKVESYPAPTAASAVSNTIVLDPPDDWIVQPALPGTSVRISHSDRRLTGLKEIEPITNDSNESLHDIMGSTLPVSTNTGGRAGDATGVSIWVPDAAAEEALMVVLRVGIPLLFQFNPLRTTHRFVSGFYSVGKVRRDRKDPDIWRGVQARQFVLPLTMAQSPVVEVSAPAFSLADVDLAFTSLADVDANYSSLENLRVDNRS